MLRKGYLLATSSGRQYATLNPATTGSGITLSNGNLTATFNASSAASTYANILKTSGKWYWEARITSLTSNFFAIGASLNTVTTTWLGNNPSQYGYRNDDGLIYTNGVGSGSGTTYTVGDIIGIAFDADSNTVGFYKNNVSIGSPASVTAGGMYAGVGGSFTSGAVTFNFGATALTYSPPAGYNAGLYN